MTKHDEYIQMMKSQLDALNAKMEDVDAKAKCAEQEACAKYGEEVAQLRHQSKVAAAKPEDLSPGAAVRAGQRFPASPPS